MERFILVLLIASIVGAIVCVTLMFASLYYGFDGQVWIDGFAISSLGLLVSIGLICHQITERR